MGAGIVGPLAGFNNNKRTIRQQTNPLDKSTVVSILPLEVKYDSPTIQPGQFVIPPGSEDKPSLLIVGPSSWWRDIGEEMPLIEIPNSSIQVADSIVRDYCNGLPEIDDNSYPGLFFIPGELTIEVIKGNYSTAFKKAVEKQKSWFNNLIRVADSDWAKTNGNPRAVSDLSKMAAKYLNLEDRPWMKSTVDTAKVACVACGNLRNPAYPICPSCNRVVDVKLAEKLGILDVVVKK